MIRECTDDINSQLLLFLRMKIIKNKKKDHLLVKTKRYRRDDHVTFQKTRTCVTY